MGGPLSIGVRHSSIALSVGEAEYYALVKAAAEGLGIQSLARDLGIELTLRLWVDSTIGNRLSHRLGQGAIASRIGSRIGLGKVRHIFTRYLWLLGKNVLEGRPALFFALICGAASVVLAVQAMRAERRTTDLELPLRS